MPDLKSELEKVIHAWDHSEQPTQTSTPEPSMDQTTVTQPRVRISEIAFNFIRDNPGVTALDVAAYLRGQGFSGSTPTSISHSLLTRGLVRRDEKRMYVTQSLYPTLDEVKVKQMASARLAKIAYMQKRAEARTKAAKKAKFVHKKKERKQPLVGIPPILPVMPVQAPATIHDADQLLATMNVMQAKAVYAKLKEIFG